MTGHCISVHVTCNITGIFLKWLLGLEVSIFQSQIETSKVLYSKVQKSSVSESGLTASNCRFLGMHAFNILLRVTFCPFQKDMKANIEISK